MLNKQLADCMEKHSLTAGSVAATVGCSRAAVGHWKTSHNPVSEKYCDKVTDYIGRHEWCGTDGPVMVKSSEPEPVSQCDRSQAERFLTLLDEEAERFTFQLFDDTSAKRQNMARVLNGSLEDHWPKLVAANQNGCGVYVTINETDLKGRKKENITRVRAIFQDDDAKEKAGFPVDPDLVVESSPGKYHRYLFTDTTRLDEFEPVLKAMVEQYGGDSNATDISRVLRLAGFYHMKGKPFMVKIISESGAQLTPWGEVKELFPTLETFSPIQKEDFEPTDIPLHIKNIITGENYNGSLCSLSSSFAARGMDYRATLEVLNGFMDSCPVQDARWKARKNHLPVVVETALSKFGANVTPEIDPADWPDPVGIETRQLPVVTKDMMPKILGDMVFALSASTETPVELSLMMCLTTCAAACQKKYSIETAAGHTEQLSLWGLAILESGNRKSSVEEAAVGPLRAWEEEQRGLLDDEIKATTAKRKNEAAIIKKLRNQLGKQKEGRTEEEAKQDIVELEMNLTKVPLLPQLWSQDITPENLGTIMHEQGERMALFSAEGGIFDIIAGRYSKGVPNLDLFLMSHSGDPVRVNRASRPPVNLREPALSIGISPQPSAVKSMMEQPGFRGRGLVARFMYMLPPSPLGTRKLVGVAPIPTSIAKAYHEAIYSLCDVEVNKTGVLKLSPEAKTLWEGFSMEVEAEFLPGGKFEYMKDWGGKFPGMVARIAGVFLCISTPNRIVPMEIMEQAIALGNVICEHSIAAFDMMGSDEGMSGARKILEWIKRFDLIEFTGRDCFEATKGTFKKVAPMNEALELLKDHCIVRERLPTVKIGRPSQVYDVNPKIVRF